MEDKYVLTLQTCFLFPWKFQQSLKNLNNIGTTTLTYFYNLALWPLGKK